MNIPAFTLTSALGVGLADHRQALLQERSGLQRAPFADCAIPTWTGQVPGLAQPLPSPFTDWDCRSNRLLERALVADGFVEAVAARVARHGAARVGLFLGTSASGVHHTELAYAQRMPDAGRLPDWFDYRRSQTHSSCTDYVALRLGLRGVSVAISTACTSSAKVFASACRAIASGLCDAAVVGGVDSLCLTTLHGFHSLQLLSADPCRPADAQRKGISIGEAAGFALIERGGEAGYQLLGYGESSDAWHMSAPQPEGLGAVDSMQAALRRAGLAPRQIDYINLHGTATPANDLAEVKALRQVFAPDTPCSSTKGWTGHTLGAAGIVEAVVSLLCIEQGLQPRSLNTQELDPALQANILMQSRRAATRHVMSNSFGFGGSNCSLVFGAAR